MSKQKQNVIVVAHPDDETIWFGALILKNRTRPWKVICVTDGNADQMGKKRRRQFEAACEKLKVYDTDWLGFPDIYEKRLDVESLQAQLLESLHGKILRPDTIFTHGILGEYGHPHHQDVSFAVHTAFRKTNPVYSVAYNCHPDWTVTLTPKQYDVKLAILTQIYGSETQRFANLLPVTATEGFARIGYEEVKTLYRYFREHKRPSPAKLKSYKWFWPYFKETYNLGTRRPF